MTVSSGALANPLPKYKNAVAVRSVIKKKKKKKKGGEKRKGLEDSLRASGYLASGTPKFHVDAEINNLQQPFAGLDLDVTADVTYKVSGTGTVAAYPIKGTGRATFLGTCLWALIGCASPTSVPWRKTSNNFCRR